jgi:mannose-6-phosphate isomerase-like protein (cupin superfamily)
MISAQRVDKPWGYELIWARTDRYVGKFLHIHKGQMLSLQYHNRKDETFYLQNGCMQFFVDEGNGLEQRELKPGDGFHIRPLVKHRMVAITDCDLVEVSTPELDDVVRLDDAYGRAGTSSP